MGDSISPCRGIVTILDEPAMAEAALAEDWDRPEDGKQSPRRAGEPDGGQAGVGARHALFPVCRH